jgi:hypothetical protein
MPKYTLLPDISTMSSITKYTISSRLTSATHPYQEQPGERHAKHPILCHLCYHIVIFCFCHLCYLISAGLKTISRKNTHPMYPRYLHVFLYMFNDLLPTLPPNLCESGLGYHCRVLVWPLAFLLN